MTPSNPSFNEVMEKLKEKYISTLQTRRPDVAEFLSRCEAGTLSDAERDTMRRLAHTMAGSGATYGYQEITRTARALEDALEENAAVESLKPLTEALLEECSRALMTGQQSALPIQKNASPQLEDKPVVLTADDDRVVREMMVSLFEPYANMITAENGEQALKMIQTERPALVLLDDAMPKMTGMKLLEKVRNDPDICETPIIMVTASNRKQDIAHATELGVTDYITKPFDPAAVANVVCPLLKRLSYHVVIADIDEGSRNYLLQKFGETWVRPFAMTDTQALLDELPKLHANLVVIQHADGLMESDRLVQALRHATNTADLPVLVVFSKRNATLIEQLQSHAKVECCVEPMMPEQIVAQGIALMEKHAS